MSKFILFKPQNFFKQTLSSSLLLVLYQAVSFLLTWPPNIQNVTLVSWQLFSLGNKWFFSHLRPSLEGLLFLSHIKQLNTTIITITSHQLAAAWLLKKHDISNIQELFRNFNLHFNFSLSRVCSSSVRWALSIFPSSIYRFSLVLLWCGLTI